MSFTIPNKAVTYPFQSRWFQCDVDILQGAAGGRTGVISAGCGVTETAIPDMNVQVAAGQVVIEGNRIDVSGQSVGVSDADPLLPRFDLIVADTDGACVALPGEPDAAPFPVSPPAGTVGLAQVFVPTASTEIIQDAIVDKRVYVPDPVAVSPWLRVGASADLTRTLNASLTDDPVLRVPVSANGKYRIRWFVPFTLSTPPESSNGGMIWSWVLSGAAIPTFSTGSHATPWNGNPAPPPQKFQASVQWNQQWGAASDTFAGDTIHDSHCYGWMVIHLNSSTNGFLTFRWGQQTAQASNLIRRAGAYVEYEVV